MEKALVVVRHESAATLELIREAATLADGVDAPLYLVHVMPESEYEDRMASRLETGSGGGTFSIDEAEREANFIAKEAGQEALEGLDVDYETIGVVGHVEEDVLEIAEREGVDHVFVAGRKRSPSGKAIFGDVAQRIILNFDGMVTIAMDEN
jgi:nucleotide-binding universal stress UspA family protein